MNPKSGTDSEVVCFRFKNEAYFQVKWKGRLCSPVWVQRGPADIYLTMLRNGSRNPEYA